MCGTQSSYVHARLRNQSTNAWVLILKMLLPLIQCVNLFFCQIIQGIDRLIPIFNNVQIEGVQCKTTRRIMACKVSVWPAWTVKLPPSCAVVYFAPNSNKYFFIVVAVKFGKRPRKNYPLLPVHYLY